MGIPIGREYSATVSGATWKKCSCESCGAVYCYEAKREAKGGGSSLLWLDNAGAEERASNSAQIQLADALAKAVDAVACPSCGWYQRDMVAQLRYQRLWWAAVATLVVAVLAWICAIVIANSQHSDKSSAGLLFVAVSVAGIAAGVIWSRLFNPNSGHQGRGGRHRSRASASRGILMADLESQQLAKREELHKKFQETLKQALLLCVAADGAVLDEKVRAMGSIYSKMTHITLVDETIRAEAMRALSQKAEIAAGTRALSACITDEAKAAFVKAAFIVATATGELSEQSREVICMIAATLKMSSTNVMGILASLRK